MIFLKIIGLIIAFFSIFTLIRYYGKYKTRELEQLDYAINSIKRLKNDVVYFKKPIRKALAESFDYKSYRFYEVIDAFIQYTEEVDDIVEYEEKFKYYYESIQHCMSKSVKSTLLKIPNLFFCNSTEDIVTKIDNIIQELEYKKENLAKEAYEQEQLYNKLSFGVACIIVIALI